MKKFRPFQLLPLAFLLGTSGCAYKVSQLDTLNPPATDFNSSLASEYHDYADSEYEQTRLFSAQHFAGKGLNAAHGEEVDPDALDTDLPAEQEQAVADGRAQLVKLLNPDMKTAAPQSLAHAQLLFDCWQNELRKHQNQAKAPCDEEFHATLTKLQSVSDNMVFGNQRSHVLVFDSHSLKLSDADMATIKDVAHSVAGLQHYRVVLMAYSGHKSLQHRLVEKRLGIVRHALVKAGVSDKHIRVHKEGGAKAVVLSIDRVSTDTKKITILVKTQAETAQPETTAHTTTGEH